MPKITTARDAHGEHITLRVPPLAYGSAAAKLRRMGYRVRPSAQNSPRITAPR